MEPGMLAGFMGGSGGGNSLDMSSGVGPFELDNDNQFGDWGGDTNIGAPGLNLGGAGLDLSNPAHIALVGAGLLILGAVLLKRAR